jgi:hypothetical protein
MTDRKSFFVTIASNQPHGAGYFEVVASSRTKAREATFNAIGNKWVTMYDSLEEVHPFDRKYHDVIEGE